MNPYQFSVFVVDDNRVTAHHLARQLHRSGFSRVRHAACADEALRLHAASENRAIWIVDCELGQVNGIELLKSLTQGQHGRSLAAIVSGSEHKGVGLTESALQCGAMAVFTGDRARHHAAVWASNLAAMDPVPCAETTSQADPKPGPGALDSPLAPPRPDERQQIHAVMQLCAHANRADLAHWHTLAACAADVAHHVGLGPAQADWLELCVGVLALPSLYGQAARGGPVAPARRRYGAPALLKADAALRDMRCRWAQLARELLQNQDEHWDGSGGPVRLSGRRIPLSARILTIAQVLVQASAFGRVQALLRESGARVDPDLAQRYLIGIHSRDLRAGH